MTPAACKRLAGLVLVGGLVIALDSEAQTLGSSDLEISNLLEVQIGRDPTSEEGERVRFFDQVLLDLYDPRGLRVGLRVERYEDSTPPTLFGGPTPEYEYDRLAQRFVEWSSLDASLRVGNGYAILGRGLLFRAFELPGVLRQTRFPTVGYAESRDLDGVIFEGQRGALSATLLHGTPVVAPDVAPEQELQTRRAGSVTGGRFGGQPLDGVALGVSYLRADGLERGATESRVEELGAVDVQLEPTQWLEDLPVYLSFYAEYAGRQWQPLDDGLRTKTGEPHALYTSTQLGWSNGALGFETKDYHQFLIGVNDAPSLVPEFTHRLLNRTTHVLEPRDEKGLQLNVAQSIPDWLGGGSVEVVIAEATGRLEQLGEYAERRRYEQGFVAVESDPAGSARARIYFSTGRDEFEALEQIRTVGVFGAAHLPRGLAAELDVAHQLRRRRDFSGEIRSEDIAVQASLSLAGRGQLGMLFERTDDPLFLDDPFTPEIEEDKRNFLAGSLSVRVDERHDVVVFFGERRGGTACTSGTCYFVPDFEGVEMRVRSRF